MPDLPATLALAGGSRNHWAFRQAAQDFAIGRLHVERQSDDVIDYPLRRQIVPPHAALVGFRQNRPAGCKGKALAMTPRLMQPGIRLAAPAKKGVLYPSFLSKGAVPDSDD